MHTTPGGKLSTQSQKQGDIYLQFARNSPLALASPTPLICDTTPAPSRHPLIHHYPLRYLHPRPATALPYIYPMDQFDIFFAFDGVSTLCLQLPEPSRAGTQVVPVLPDTSDVAELSFDDVPMDYDHRSNGFPAYCVIA
ncbi:hypothetical protein OH76DRAFT_1408532 [Lentinus brumalis]|uniref:Uncharacterized protein n=1 Tax=Lentinus brumalis TaxID=2498619 RepID=A0A371CXA7_9APHY|nr:hypothetical protein OH76DRAFT_1408532 [Polyporus brumalis]